MHSSVENCFPRPRALYFPAPGGGAFFPHQRALQNRASGGGKFGIARASGLQRAETEVYRAAF
jgi:hypothetical protein